MIKFIEAKKNYIMALAVLFVVVSLSGTTYSLFIKSDSTNTFNYHTGLLDLQFIEDEQIKLESAFPMIDSEGIKQKSYKLTLKNTGTLTYLFDLKMLSDTNENVIDSKYIKVKVNDDLPHTLFATDNVIASNLIIHPEEEMTFNVTIWLDLDTPNKELGKSFNAKVVTTGSSIYKTLDSSGANYPNTKQDMLPVYYDETSNNWKKADKSNLTADYQWYDYDKSMWANVITLKNSDKYIYDITGNNNLNISDIKYNNTNAIIEDNYLDIGLSNYNSNLITSILRIKTSDKIDKNIYFLTNGNISYYYDHVNKRFVFSSNQKEVSSSPYSLNENTWYILGVSYDSNKVVFYVNGEKISETYLSGSIASTSSFKVGTNMQEVSTFTLGDIYLYNSILSSDTINTSYNDSINVIYDNLLLGYNEFIPMTTKEYYLSRKVGATINFKDIEAFYVWIPRFKYKLWNVTGESNIASYDAYNQGIDITFEKDTTSSGVVYCDNSACYRDELLITKVTSEDNDKYYTHPAFTKKEKAISGIWVGKYEITSENIASNNQDNNVWTNSSFEELYNQVLSLGEDYSLIKNTDWGAITYLSHSTYGICKNNTCTNIDKNNTMISGKNIKDSTTGNMYGIFDMAGNAQELTMAKYLTNEEELSQVNSADYDIYYENTFILGDATKELNTSSGIWQNAEYNELSSTNSYLARGGIANRNITNIFSYNATTNTANNYLTSRLTIK